MRPSIGDRMKRYEWASSQSLTPRSPLVIRVDGRAFHSFLRGSQRPFDYDVVNAMLSASEETARAMQGFKLAYTQSDECTFLLTDYDEHKTQGWFDYKLAKVVSISASTFTAAFNRHYPAGEGRAIFDSRAFTVPFDDAPNVFVWRQQDWERNSVQMLAQAHFSQKELNHKSVQEIHKMLLEKGIKWSSLSPQIKHGSFVIRDGSMLYEKLSYPDLRNLISPLSPAVDDVST